MARRPIDVYRGLLEARVDPEILPHIDSFVNRFTDHTFAGHPISAHLKRFLDVFARLVAYLDTRSLAGLGDLTIAIDTLDYFSSTTKWWPMDRRNPELVIRPPSQDPREFMLSIASVTVGSTTMSRVTGSIERMARFLDEHEVKSQESRDILSESLASIWVLLSAFSAKSQGRIVTSEDDFECVYDVVRILLFHTDINEFRALSAIRRIGTNQLITRTASVILSSEFEDRIESSIAARLERTHISETVKQSSLQTSYLRSVLTNSLRLLIQLEAATQNLNRVEADQYDSLTSVTMQKLQKSGIDVRMLHDESAAVAMFEKLQIDDALSRQLGLLVRRVENLIVASTGHQDFLLENNRIVPRILSLIILFACGSIALESKRISYSDVKTGLILLDRVLRA